jgi:hypothetical protein
MAPEGEVHASRFISRPLSSPGAAGLVIYAKGRTMAFEARHQRALESAVRHLLAHIGEPDVANTIRDLRDLERILIVDRFLARTWEAAQVGSGIRKREGHGYR